MIDLEKMKSLIELQWEKYKHSIEKTENPSVFYDEDLYRFYIDRAKKYKYRAQGMEDLLYSLGYIVLHCPDGTNVNIIERIDREG